MPERKMIVEKFFEKGHLLTPDALEFLMNSRNREKLLGSIEFVDKIILEKDDFAVFSNPDSVKILKNIVSKPSELTPEIFNKALVSKFDLMKTIFVERTGKNFISLDKIDNNRNEVHVIGLVREIKKEENKLTLELEDMTRSLQVVFENYTPKIALEEDDVIAVGGIGSKEMIFGKDIIYPDVPLREPAKGAGKICIISDLHLDEAPLGRFSNFLKWLSGEKDIKYLVVAGDIGDKGKFSEMIKNYITEKIVFVIPGNKDTLSYPALPLEIKNDSIISLSNPSLIEVNGIKMLIIHSFDQNFLKKRYLGKSSMVLDRDFLALDILPDIVACGHTHEPYVSNYKSITIANPGSLLADFKPVIIDLETREYKQLDFEEE